MAKDLSISILLDFYGEMLTEKQRELMTLYYDDDLSLSEISENEKITRQGVHDSIKRSEIILLDMESKLELVKKFNSINSQIDEISVLAQKIHEENHQFCYSTQINNNSLKIIDIAKHINY